eukprot:8562765-Pyramimonas_sp.AAC.1
MPRHYLFGAAARSVAFWCNGSLWGETQTAPATQRFPTFPLLAQGRRPCLEMGWRCFDFRKHSRAAMAPSRLLWQLSRAPWRSRRSQAQTSPTYLQCWRSRASCTRPI